MTKFFLLSPDCNQSDEVLSASYDAIPLSWAVLRLEQIFRSVKAANRTHRLCYVEDLLSAGRAEKMPKMGAALMSR
ncbi:hypothetical protein HMPREF7545_0820 [Selenomonas noxia ATCC 43541]|nr:hypothetical protein HMPREF7545_0820 [Selenomonas noxia ATCC 43541]